ncbi:hypothetical protein [Acidithiobacillus concretivorus]|uniref:Uncharacterized protein n=1 Tax=Acidithiobacillus concretivorus TaxID=3063952 RepID=A0ABS5ZTV2_9PROT|nr:hypothetical protein [Acidithiobacillus concretivorus]MBU2740021.1 hypothetical protein [Acidithiobacillus concretivorus]
MKLKIGDWYILANTAFPEDRSRDRTVVITDLNHKSVFFDQKAGPGLPSTGSFMISRANFRKYLREVED